MPKLDISSLPLDDLLALYGEVRKRVTTYLEGGFTKQDLNLLEELVRELTLREELR